ncbi:discoidin domain-containing protein [Streptomyces sp. NRRL B-24484]|uniref:discoidin domain-containing protein n=1 Tax=Streptomyces sp. NRRL B-24484 TaxID=1463833 RepID=UPI0004BEF5A9|nr:discoidin domain-containing protein [Streptomyces sp. NRRL B-24484]
MGISRRSLLLTAAASSTAGLLPTASARAAGSPPGDVVGRITVGYQGWFACPGDGAPINGWWHWSRDWSQAPSPTNDALRAWPDMREYTAGHRTAYGPLGDGTACSSDHYLRLTADGGRMRKGQLALTPVRPTPPPPAGDLALRRPTAESSRTQVYGSGNAVDGDPNSYWESANSAFPQWIQADLQAVHPVRRPVLAVPPAPAWAARTQTVAVLGSTDGTAFTTRAGAAGYRLDPATGNTVTLTLPAAVQSRYLRLQFTGSTGWPAGQLSALQAFAQ